MGLVQYYEVEYPEIKKILNNGRRSFVLILSIKSDRL